MEFEYGGLAVAAMHALYNGLAYPGEKFAFSPLAQLVLENAPHDERFCSHHNRVAA